MKNKINEQLLLVVFSVIMIVVVIVVFGFFKNKSNINQTEVINPEEGISATILSGDPSEMVIPLSKGSYWLYKVTGEEQGVQAVDGKEMPIIKTDKQVTVEVLNYVKRNPNIQAALLTGYPGMNEKKSTLIVVAGKGFYLVEGEEAFSRISNIKDDLTDLYTEDHLILPFPLAINKKFGCMDDSMDRKDNYYCYWVESIKPADAKLYPNKKQYQISLHTLPDVTNVYYVDGVGVTGFNYHHNGTLLEEKWELIKYFIAK